MPQNNPKPGEIYRHFKGNLYQIITLAVDADDGSRVVVYQGLYAPFTTYTRSFDDFIDGVDYEKYPEATDRFRFTLMHSATIRQMAKSAASVPSEAQIAKAPASVLSEAQIAKAPASVPLESQRAKTAVSESPASQPDIHPAPIEVQMEESAPSEIAEETSDTLSLMMDFLDAHSFEEKVSILERMALQDDLNDIFIDNMAAAIDVVIDEGPVEKRFKELRNCVETRARYELLRLRN